MTDTIEREPMLDKMPSDWDFPFWKERYESATDVASALGILGVASYFYDWEGELTVYLMDIADAESITDERTRALAGKALQALHRVLERHRGSSGDSINHTRLHVVEKALWFVRPAADLKSLVNPLSGSDEEVRYVRRYLRSICSTIWDGYMGCASHEHKLQVLDTFYASGKLMELVPNSKEFYGVPRQWNLFEDTIPRLEELARLDLGPDTKTVEELAFHGYTAAYVLLLVNAVLPAGRAYYERHELARLRRKT